MIKKKGEYGYRKYFKIKKDGINLEPINIRMQTYENLIKKEKEEKFWKN